MPQLVNWDLLKNPYNYVVVWLMLGIALIALTYLAPSKSNPVQ